MHASLMWSDPIFKQEHYCLQFIAKCPVNAMSLFDQAGSHGTSAQYNLLLI